LFWCGAVYHLPAVFLRLSKSQPMVPEKFLHLNRRPCLNRPVSSNSPEIPVAPMIATPPGPTRQPMDNALRLVVTLMFVYLAMSLGLSILLLVFHNSFVNYELARTQVPAGSTTAAIRHSLQDGLWGRLVGGLAIAAVYVWRAFRLRDGKRGTYFRMIGICVFGLAYLLYLLASAKYPAWMRVEQVVQGVVLILLLLALTRRRVRDRFAKQ
jgi:hypothetical protein